MALFSKYVLALFDVCSLVQVQPERFCKMGNRGKSCYHKSSELIILDKGQLES